VLPIGCVSDAPFLAPLAISVLVLVFFFPSMDEEAVRQDAATGSRSAGIVDADIDLDAIAFALDTKRIAAA
jgi:hypothetical protein